MKDIPESVQWLLDFVNLASIQGEPNHPRLLPKEQRKLKRPPNPPKYLPNLRPDEFPFIDKNTKRIWKRTANGEIEYEGLFHIPLWRDFKAFFLNQGIPPKKGKDIRKISDDISLKVWFTWIDFFEYVSNLSNNARCDDLYLDRIQALYVNCLKKDNETESYINFIIIDCIKKKLPFPHNNLLPCALYALILDFGLNRKELHSHLRHCKYCGTFVIEESKKGRGRPRTVFCGKVCKDKFHGSSRDDNEKCVKKIRADNKEFQQKEDVILIEKWLVDKEKYKQKEAKERAHKLVYEYGETFKNYKRKAIQKFGISI